MTDRNALQFINSEWNLNRNIWMPKKRRDEWKQSYVLTLTGAQAHDMLKVVLPYLITKKKEAEDSVEYYENRV